MKLLITYMTVFATKIYNFAQRIFLQNYMLIKDNEAYDYSDSEAEDNFRE